MARLDGGARELLRDPRLAVALGFGAGLMPRAPGTAGAVLGVGLAWLLAALPAGLSAALLALAFGLGVHCGSHAMRRLGLKDPGAVVWDEVVGMAVTLWALPPGLVTYALGFVLFRFFDIFKPWPIRTLDRNVHGGFGIMLDDLVAGVLAGICLQAFLAARAALGG